MITETTSQSDSSRWCAPELFEAQAAVSAHGDIYAFGMTILEVDLVSFVLQVYAEFCTVVYTRNAVF